jgi:hypothetical protein
MGRRNTKTDVVVEVAWLVVVAIRTAGVPAFIVERAATQDTALIGQPYCPLDSEAILPHAPKGANAPSE